MNEFQALWRFISDEIAKREKESDWHRDQLEHMSANAVDKQSKRDLEHYFMRSIFELASEIRGLEKVRTWMLENKLI